MGMELDILRGCEIAPIDDTVDLDNNPKFKKLELTQGQKIQMSALMNQLPALAGMDILSKTMVLTFPEGVQGVLMQLKNGGFTTTLKKRGYRKNCRNRLAGICRSASSLSRCVYCDVDCLWSILSGTNQ